MDDFILISAAWFLEQQVTTYDESGNVVPEDRWVSAARR